MCCLSPALEKKSRRERSRWTALLGLAASPAVSSFFFFTILARVATGTTVRGELARRYATRVGLGAHGVASHGRRRRQAHLLIVRPGVLAPLNANITGRSAFRFW